MKNFYKEYERLKEWFEVDSVSEVVDIIEDEWGEDGLRGYGIFTSDDTDVEHIERIDELDIYECDLDAARQAEEDGIKLIHDVDIPKDSVLYPYKDTFVDTPENRKQLEKELSYELSY